MDLEFGGCQDVINKYRQDWSLEHDVKLLKFLEKFSQSLLSRTGVALKAVECFEQDLTTLSLNIQTVTQRFQSLSNKQFIEHCVLEEDISSYSKPNQNAIEVHSSNTNILLNNALKSCLSSFHVHIKDSNDLNKSNHSATIDQQLPPLIGSSQFKDYYAQIFRNKHKQNNSTQNFKADQKNSSQNIYEEQLNNSTHGTMDEDNNSILNNHDVLNGIRDSNCSIDIEDTTHGNNAILKVDSSPKEFVPKVDTPANPANNLATDSDKISIVNTPKIIDDSYKIIQAKINAEISSYNDSKSTSKIPSESRSYTNNMNKLKSPSFVPENDFFSNIMQVPKTQSLFDQDETEDPDDLFMYGKAKPFLDNDDIEDKEQFSSNGAKGSSHSFSTRSTSAKSDKQNESDLPKKEESLKSDIQHNFEKNNDTLKTDLKQNVIQVSNDMVDSENLPTPGKRMNSQTVASSGEVESPFSASSFSAEVKDESKKFTLFSDHEESDDELFVSAKQKNSKENFKKLLEEKISAFGAKSFVPNRNTSKREQEEVKTENSSSTIRFEDNGILPKCETSVLQSLVKNRPKVRNKRRPPSRKHLINSHSDSTKTGTGEQQEEGLYKVKENNVTILSPSTEEEDLFVVPTTSMVHEISSSDLFSASSLLSPGSSLDTPQACSSDFPNNLMNQGSSNYVDTSTSLHSEVKTEVCSSISNVSLFSTEPPPFDGEFFDDNNSGLDRSVKPWNNNLSLFSDSDEDNDLFSTSNKVRLFNDHKVTSVSNIKSGLYTVKPSHKKDNDFFKEIFLSNSDDDDLFKSKETPTVSQNKSDNVPKQKSEKVETNTKFNGNSSLTSATEFVDPLSCFDNTVTE